MKSLSLKSLWRAGVASVRESFTFDESPRGRRKRKEVFILAGIFCALIISALVVGVSDNIPGIVLCYLAAVVLAAGVTRSWRRTKKFLVLLVASAVGFFVFVFLHNAFYALAMLSEDIAALSHLMEALNVVFFIIAAFLCPALFAVGAAGSIACAIMERRKGAAG
jgi:uncharacterized membrane protein